MQLIHPYKKFYDRANDAFPGPALQWSVTRYDTNQTVLFNSRSAALIYQKNTPAPTQTFFHFFERQMSRLDFRTEPSRSIDQLLKERAQELRDSYKYLRLWVSGGSDSMTALHSFLKNHIHIDEIVMHLYDNDVLNSTPIFMKESVLDVAIPYIHQHQDQLKNTKITVYRSNLDTLSQWHVDPDLIGEAGHVGCLDAMGTQLRLPTSGAMAVLREPDTHSWCDIIGGQKTKICLRNNRWYVYDIDVSFLTSALATTTEDFFISRSVPTLFLKTAWTLKKYFQSRAMSSDEIDQWCLLKINDAETRRLYNTAIGRIPLLDCSYNKTSPGMLESDESVWVRMTNSAASSVTKIYLENKKLLSLDNTTGYISRFYCLDDGKNYDSHGIW